MFNRRSLAKSRGQFYRIIRDFFEDRGFLETHTPLLSPSLIPESAIEVFSTTFNKSRKDTSPLYLVPSPEFFMKQLIAEGFGDIFQITPCFRNAEIYTPKHYCEFTMLEWYAMNKDYKDNITIQKDLLMALSDTAAPETQHFFKNYTEVTVSDLMLEYSGIDLQHCTTLSAFKAHATNKGFSDYAARSETWETLFNFIFVGHVENHIPTESTVFVKDYPAQIPTTAKRNGHFYERWEFYMKGWEMANCYTEEARYEEMLQLFQQEEKAKALMMTPHKVDYDYLNIFKDNFPMCSGVALGLDRLFTLYMNAKSLNDVSLFPLSKIMT